MQAALDAYCEHVYVKGGYAASPNPMRAALAAAFPIMLREVAETMPTNLPLGSYGGGMRLSPVVVMRAQILALADYYAKSLSEGSG